MLMMLLGVRNTFDSRLATTTRTNRRTNAICSRSTWSWGLARPRRTAPIAVLATAAETVWTPPSCFEGLDGDSAIVHLPRGGSHQRLAIGFAAGEASHEPTAVHHDDAVAHAHNFWQLGRDQQHPHALPCQLGDQRVDLGFGMDVDSLGGFVQDQ